MSSSSKRYLVTGGAGFIGSHLVAELLSRGHAVRVLDDFTTGKRQNLDGLRGDLEVITGDIRSADAVREALRGVTHVLHQAALPSVARSVGDPLKSHDVNATGTLNVLVQARDAKVKRLVFASSSSVYGDTPTLPKHEDMPVKPQSPYATSKAMGEFYCLNFHRLYGLETVVLRYFNVFGPRQDPKGAYAAAIPAFMSAMLEGRAPVVKGDGLQTRDFTYVQNVVHANMLAAERPEAPGHVMNVGAGQRTSLLDLLAELGKLTGAAVEPAFEDPRPGDVRDSLAAIEVARRVLGYEPQVNLSEGLRRTLAAWREAQPGSPRT